MTRARDSGGRRVSQTAPDARERLRVNGSLPSLGMLVVEAPLPPRALSPNAQAGSGRLYKSSQVEAYKRAVYVLAVDACNRAKWRTPRRARLHLVFGLKRPPRRRGERSSVYIPADVDNAISSVKAGIDGLVQAGVIEDDDWEHLGLGSVEHSETETGVVYVVEAVA